MKKLTKNLIDFRCYSCGNNVEKQGITAGNTQNESYKLVYVFDGCCWVCIDKTSYEVKKGSSFVVFPYSDFEISDDKSAKYAWIEFTGFHILAILGRTAFTKSNPVVGDIGIEGFEQYFEMPAVSFEPFVLYRIGGRLMELLSFYMEKFPGKHSDTDSYVLSALAVIEKNFENSGFGVKDVVEQLKIDRSYLYRLFKDETGVSVIDYITRRRVSRAEIMLANSKASIKDVAYSSGFSDQLYFSRVFKRLNGRTPSEFRKMIFKNEF